MRLFFSSFSSPSPSLLHNSSHLPTLPDLNSWCYVDSSQWLNGCFRSASAKVILSSLPFLQVRRENCNWIGLDVIKVEWSISRVSVEGDVEWHSVFDGIWEIWCQVTAQGGWILIGKHRKKNFFESLQMKLH